MNTLLTFICVFIFIGMVVFVLYLVYDEFIIERVNDEQITGECHKENF